LFGGQSFTLNLAQSGALEKVSYSADTGANQAAGALGSIVDVLNGSTAAEKAAQYKSEADLIVQQQRVILCVKDNANCK
jgi:hypothetical protein